MSRGGKRPGAGMRPLSLGRLTHRDLAERRPLKNPRPSGVQFKERRGEGGGVVEDRERGTFTMIPRQAQRVGEAQEAKA